MAIIENQEDPFYCLYLQLDLSCMVCQKWGSLESPCGPPNYSALSDQRGSSCQISSYSAHLTVWSWIVIFFVYLAVFVYPLTWCPLTDAHEEWGYTTLTRRWVFLSYWCTVELGCDTLCWDVFCIGFGLMKSSTFPKKKKKERKKRRERFTFEKNWYLHKIIF